MEQAPNEAAAMDESTVVGMVMQEPVWESSEDMEKKKKMKVMVAVDESDGSLYALSWAVEHLFTGPSLDDNERHGRVTVVTAQQPFQHYVFPSGPGGTAFYAASTTLVESVRKGQEENSAMILSRALQLCKTKMVKAETLILTGGDPKEMICEAADEMHMDLLVVGSRGLGLIKRTFLGSVSDYCTHHAKCPVLIVKPPSLPSQGNQMMSISKLES